MRIGTAPTGSGLTPLQRKSMLLDGLRNQIGNCTRCSLCDYRKHLVFGGGNPDAPIMLVGGSVTWQEDVTGRVLVGDHGGLVSYALARVGLDIQRDVYACTVIKCQRPQTIKDGEKTRADPTPDQIKACSKFVRAQIAIVNPVILVAHGRLACTVLFGEHRPLNKFCGSWRTMGRTRLGLAMHNPAGLVFGERKALQPEFLEAYDGLAERLSMLGRMWKPDAACFQAGWSYQGIVQ